MEIYVFLGGNNNIVQFADHIQVNLIKSEANFSYTIH